MTNTTTPSAPANQAATRRTTRWWCSCIGSAAGLMLASCSDQSHPARSADAPAHPTTQAAADPPSATPPALSAQQQPLAAASPSPARSIAGFVPSSHGFAFVNSFSGWPAPGRTIDTILARSLGGSMDYGLCGGMSFAAADYYLAGRPRPAGSKPPAAGSALYETLYRRQVDSLGAGLIGSLRFLAWMALGDRAVGQLTVAELPAIVDALDRGRPVVLGLVYQRIDRSAAVWHNHQVLAYRVADRSASGVSLAVYDPNYPGRDSVLISVRSLDGSPIADGPAVRCARLVPGRRARPIRGVFAMPYAYRPPPEHAITAEAAHTPGDSPAH